MNGETVTVAEAKTLKRVITLGILGLVGLIITFGAFVSVDAGTVGVIKRFGGTTGQVLQPGFNTKLPIIDDIVPLNTKKISYETAEEEKWKGSDATYKDYPVDTYTSDGQGLDMTYTIRFSIDPMKAVWVVNNIGNENAVVEQIVKNQSRSVVREVPTGFTAAELYSDEGQASAQNEITSRLRPVFEENGLFLDAFLIRKPGFDPEYLAVLEQKQRAEETVKVKEHEAQAALFERNKRISEAEGEAKAQELLSKAASEMSIELRKLEIQGKMIDMLSEKWGGNVPNYIIGDISDTGIFPMMQIPQP